MRKITFCLTVIAVLLLISIWGCKKEDPEAQETAPQAPSGLQATPVSSSEIDLTWTDKSDNENGFEIERSADNSVWSQIAITSTNKTNYRSSSLTPSTPYFFRIRAFNGFGNSAYSVSATATTLDPPLTIPSAPTNLNAVAVSSSQINLTWTDNSNNETGFRIERSPNNSTWTEIATVNAGVTSYENTGLTASTPYYYRVRSYNSAGNSSFTSAASATTQASPPAAPTNLTATAASSVQINLAWTDNANNEQNFILERAPGGTSDFAVIATLNPNTTTYSNSGLTASTPYNYRVKAVNAGGSSAYSNVAGATTSPAATIPTISAPATSTGTFTITMTYPFGGYLGSSSDGYYLEESTTSPSSGFALVRSNTNTRVTSWSTSFTKTTGTYYYRVRCYNVNQYSPYSNVISVAVNATPPKAILHITNNTKYDMIDIRLNNVQHVTQSGTGILIGGSYNVEFTSSGTVSYILGVGFWNGSSRDVWFYLSGSTTVTLGSTTNLTFNNPTIGQLLSGFSTSRNWNGYYFDAGYNYHTCRFNFTNTGSWTFYDGSSQTGSGSVTLVSWPNYATIVTFKICSSCANIQLAYPFGSFMYSNGPASWPIIEYTGQ
ncbi:MAG: fibronectin type III domain-containing protein [Bacteroidales bacterium]|nr:fibronectin type III domain-containing protein [Bacteroidales bacterium]MBN2633781.1 fibronectin type III domain-containing protein [Bacteroidales bacterium]